MYEFAHMLSVLTDIEYVQIICSTVNMPRILYISPMDKQEAAV